MLPSLSVDQKEREKIGSIARICANGGLFFVVAGILPITEAFGEKFGGLQKGFFVFSIMVVLIMIAGQCITLFGVKETVHVTERKSTSIRELLGIIYKNDQLFFTAIAMSLFMIGYVTTTSFGVYFFKYAYGDEGMYPLFALILGVSQITALAVFPLFSKKYDRKTLYTAAIILVVTGYLVFFFAPVTTMLFIGIAGILLFVGQAFVQLLMLMFLADSVDYGHWKLGKRNDSITFSIQPFINKMGGAISSGVVAAVAIVSGINDAQTASDVSSGGLFLMKVAMLIFPLLCIAGSYLIYRMKYRIDSKFYAQILSDLKERGELQT
jgi:melibiose permease/lactose/raffinose/galactose permease